jgi:hypothetical protein
MRRWQPQAQQPGRQLARRAVHRDPLMVWEDSIDLGEGIIPIHLLNQVCAVHLRQEHGFKRWQISRFKQTYPWLSREDGSFAFVALHYLVHVLVHVEEAAVPLDESGTVAFLRLIKPPGVTDHLNP